MEDKDTIDKLLELATLLQDFALSKTPKSLPFKDDDHLGLMILIYTNKQFQHLQSFLSLVKSGNFRDTGLVSRTMIEGLAHLYWAAEKSDIRAYRFRAFSALIDLRKLHTQEQAGQTIDLAHKEKIYKKIDEHKRILLKPKYLKVKERDIPLDPAKRYIQNWFINEKGEEERLKDIIESISTFFGPLLKEIYEENSKRIHSQHEDIQLILKVWNYSFPEQSKTESGRNLIAAIFCFSSTLQMLDRRLNLGFEQELQDIIDYLSNAV